MKQRFWCPDVNAPAGEFLLQFLKYSRPLVCPPSLSGAGSHGGMYVLPSVPPRFAEHAKAVPFLLFTSVQYGKPHATDLVRLSSWGFP